VLAVILLLASNAYGNPENESVVVIVQNGGVIKGEIIERVEGEYIVVKRSIGAPVKIPFSKIAQIIPNDSKYAVEQGQYTDSIGPQGYDSLTMIFTFVHLQLHLRSSDEISAAGVSGVVGLLTNRSFSLGPGIGLDIHKEGSLVPIYTEFTLYFTTGKWAPFVYGRAGFAIGWLRGQHGANFGGTRSGFGFGIQRKAGRRSLLTAQVGVERQSLAREYADFVVYPDWLSFAVGVKF